MREIELVRCEIWTKDEFRLILSKSSINFHQKNKMLKENQERSLTTKSAIV